MSAAEARMFRAVSGTGLSLVSSENTFCCADLCRSDYALKRLGSYNLCLSRQCWLQPCLSITVFLQNTEFLVPNVWEGVLLTQSAFRWAYIPCPGLVPLRLYAPSLNPKCCAESTWIL